MPSSSQIGLQRGVLSPIKAKIIRTTIIIVIIIIIMIIIIIVVIIITTTISIISMRIRMMMKIIK